MRILIATWHRNIVGGTEKYIQQILPALIGRGHETAIAHECRHDPRRECIDDTLPDLRTWCLEERGHEDLLQQVHEWNPDLVYAQGLSDGSLEDAFLDRYPTILFAHGYYGACISGTKCHSLPIIRPCSRRFGPACLALYYPRRCGGLDPLRAWENYLHSSRRNARLSRYTAVLVASQHMRNEFLRHGVAPGKLHLAPLPVVSPESKPEPATLNPTGLRLLFMGRLTSLKGGAYLIRAIARAVKRLDQPILLRVAGSGKTMPVLKKLAVKLRVQVEFTGWLDSAGRLEVLRSTDLLVVPSLWPEPFGLVGIEAGSLGIPAVGYAVGGIPDWLLPGESGELAPGDPPSVAGLSDALVRALADTAHYEDLCKGARAVSQRFTLMKHLDKLETILTLHTPPRLDRRADHQVND